MTTTRDDDRLAAALMEAALDAIIVMNEHGRVVEFNPTAERLFGYRRDQAVGEKLADLIVPPALRERHQAGYHRYVETGVSRIVGSRIEIEAMRADGSLFPVEMTLIETRVGQERLFAAHLRDLTERRRLEAEAAAQRERLLALEKLSALGTLLSGVAHELNNPLAIILAQSTLLAEKARDDDTRRRAERILGASERCSRILKSFMAMARQKPQRQAEHDPNAMIRDAVELTAYGRRSGGIDTRLDLGAGLPMVSCDRDLIGQAFSHLLVFAQSRAMARENGRAVTVRTGLRDGFVVVEIGDNGPPVPAHLVPRLFDPYTPTDPAGAGTGIGLHVAHDTISAHGGRLVHAGADENGTVFRAFLPASSAGGPPDGQALVRRHALIVDDEADVGRSLADLLGELGCTSTVVDSGEEALRRLPQEPFDLVISDYRMPGMDGRTLLRRVAEARPDLTGRCVLATGDVIGAENGGAGPIMLAKPFSLRDVREMLGQLPPA